MQLMLMMCVHWSLKVRGWAADADDAHSSGASAAGADEPMLIML